VTAGCSCATANNAANIKVTSTIIDFMSGSLLLHGRIYTLGIVCMEERTRGKILHKTQFSRFQAIGSD
jgi:hypothetical protein